MIGSLLLYTIGLVSIWCGVFLSWDVFTIFKVLFFVTLVAYPPKIVLSPLTFFYAYYGLWFVLAPMYAEKYQGVLSRDEYKVALAFAYTLFGLGVYGVKVGEYFAARVKLSVSAVYIPQSRKKNINYLMLLFVISSLCILMIVLSSGGFSVWMNEPGDAFLNRGGSGVYVILSHFFSICLAAFSGYLSFFYKERRYILSFFLWLILTSPVHGSKLQITLLTIVALLPWLKTISLISVKSMLMLLVVVAIFFLGLYFRNLSWISLDTIIGYSLNYFTALENLALSIRDFQPDFLKTFFLPFVKFLTPFGLERPDMYFDMNHMLTDYYYPKAWEIRATEQWPVETDLYLNFHFFLGIPLFFIYIFLVSFYCRLGMRKNSLGSTVAAVLLSIFMISHLRGSLYNHTDFYMYPMIYLIYKVLNRFHLKNVVS